MPVSESKRVAVIGGGCTGITSFWALQNSNHDVHLFEASACLGGRVKSLPFEHNECRVHVNSEPSSFNAQASPNFASLLRHLGIPVTPVSLDFSTSTGTNTLQWRFNILKSIALDPEIHCKFELLQILFDIIRFKYLAVDVLLDKAPSHGNSFSSPSKKHHGNQSALNVDEYLTKEGFSAGFRDQYLTPLISTLWRTNAGRFLPGFPIKPLVRSLYNHHLLCTSASPPQWQQLDQGASQFIQTMTRDLPAANVHLRSRVVEVKHSTSQEGQFLLATSDGQKEHFDHVIFAVDSREILRILHPIRDVDEQNVLRDLGTSKHVGVLHSDPSLMPKPTSAYNYIAAPNATAANNSNNNKRITLSPTKSPSRSRACLTYNINTVQSIPAPIFGRIAISLNPFTPPHPSLVQGVWEYTSSPDLNAGTPRAVSKLVSIQNKRGISYCVGWTGRGFWEDAVTSGLVVAVGHLGARVPFRVEGHCWDDTAGFDCMDAHVDMDMVPGTGKRAGIMGKKNVGVNLRLRDHLIRTLLRVIHVYILLMQVLLYLGLLGISRLPGREIMRLLLGGKDGIQVRRRTGE